MGSGKRFVLTSLSLELSLPGSCPARDYISHVLTNRRVHVNKIRMEVTYITSKPGPCRLPCDPQAPTSWVRWLDGHTLGSLGDGALGGAGAFGCLGP